MSQHRGYKTEQQFWIELAQGKLGLYDDIYRNGGKFLATASGMNVENTAVNLSEGSAALLLGSRIIKEYAEAWRTEGAGSVQ